MRMWLSWFPSSIAHTVQSYSDQVHPQHHAPDQTRTPWATCAQWWGGAERKGRKESERAWKISAEDIRERGYNLDIKNPHTKDEDKDQGDPEQLLAELIQAEAEVAGLRAELKKTLSEALLR